MEPMFQRFFLRLRLPVAVIGLIVLSLAVNAQESQKRGRKYKAPLPTARIEVTVLRDVNGKPVENAAVIFHSMVGNKDEGNMELKTNEDGKAVIDVLPLGDRIRLQVVAHGFQTYGEDYNVDKAQLSLEIRLKRPGEQYSIYKMRSSEPAKDGAQPAEKPAAQPDAQGSQPPASK
jgi:hypothetical protein